MTNPWLDEYKIEVSREEPTREYFFYNAETYGERPVWVKLSSYIWTTGEISTKPWLEVDKIEAFREALTWVYLKHWIN